VIVPEGLDQAALPADEAGQSPEQDPSATYDDDRVVPRERFDGLMARLQREITEKAGMKVELEALKAQTPPAQPDPDPVSHLQDSDDEPDFAASLKAEIESLRQELDEVIADKYRVAPTSPPRQTRSQTQRLQEQLDREFGDIMAAWRSS